MILFSKGFKFVMIQFDVLLYLIKIFLPVSKIG